MVGSKKAPSGTKQPGAFSKGQPASGSKAAYVNPFDKFANARKKHEVLNRRAKGEDRNVGRARAKAIDDRKKKLLKDYQSSKKSNSFVDRRFGENDADMSLEEKMLVRFQKERVKKAKNLSMYNLDDGEGDEHLLTHKGSVLGASNMADEGWVSSGDEDEGDQRLGREVVNALHFGGGLVPKKGSTDPAAKAPDHDHPKSRAEILQEVIMKSKMHKMIKKETKDAIEAQRDTLDKEFDTLMSSSTVKMKPNDKYARNKSDGDGATDAFADYDALFGAMQTEARAAPSDRTKTAEELAAAARERLEKLEAERARRMNPDASEAEGALKISASKKRRMNDDEVEFGDNYGWKNGASSEEEEGEDEDEDDVSGEEDEEDGSGEDEDEEEDDYSEDEEGEEDDDGSEDIEDDDDDDDDDDSEDISIDEEDGSEEGANDSRVKATDKDASKAQRAADIDYPENDGVNPKMPHKIECPADINALDDLIGRYVIDPSIDLAALVGRILTWNSVHLPGAQGARNRESMHNFLDTLVKLFVRIGSDVGKPNSNYTMDQIDLLSRAINSLCHDMPEASSHLMARWLSIVHSQLEKRLRDYVQGSLQGSCWPPLGQLLMLQLLGKVYAVTDYRHAILASSSLLLCQCLSQCPVDSVEDVCRGLLSCSIILAYTAETRRLVPEVVTFTSMLFALYSCKPCAEVLPHWSRTVNVKSLTQWVIDCVKMGPASNSSSPILFSWLNGQFQDKSKEAYEPILNGALTIVKDCHNRLLGSAAYGEAMGPLLRTVSSIDTAHLSVDLSQSVNKVRSAMEAESQRSQSMRVPLTLRAKKTEVIESLEPRYEVNYRLQKDLDTDKARVQLKQLTRQSKREHKAAMRELRRDADFLDEEMFKTRQAKAEKRKQALTANYAWMEEQQATVNQQVRKGGELIKGGGSGGARPIKRQRREKR